MARVRHVVDRREVAHLWAHQAQDHARNKTDNFYFLGDTIYSYGPHFPIASHITRGKQKCILFTTKTRSVTTAGHISDVWRAIPPDVQVFHVNEVRPSGREDHLTEFNGYATRVASLGNKAKKARQNKPFLLDQIKSLIAEANAYARFFGLRRSLKEDDNLDALIAEAKQKNKEYEDSRLRKEAENQKRFEAEQEENIERWKNGESVWLSLWLTKTYLRMVEDPIDKVLSEADPTPQMIQTSRGALFPLEHAKLAFRLIQKIRAQGGEYSHNGHSIHLGHYTIDSIDKEGNVCAGCHFIEWDEIARIATQLGLIENPELEGALQ
jgi:hypothetical protein